MSVPVDQTAPDVDADTTTDHEKWPDDFQETQGARPGSPIIGDADLDVSTRDGMVGMLPAETEGDARARTAADDATAGNVFVIGPDKKVRLMHVYPMTTGRTIDEVLGVIGSLQLTPKHRVATPVNRKQGEDVVISGTVGDEEAEEIFGAWKAPTPSIRIVPEPE